MKVEVLVKGRKYLVTPKQAGILVRVGRGSYLTKDMVAVEPVQVFDIVDTVDPAEEEKPKRKYTRRKKEEDE